MAKKPSGKKKNPDVAPKKQKKSKKKK